MQPLVRPATRAVVSRRGASLLLPAGANGRGILVGGRLVAVARPSQMQMASKKVLISERIMLQIYTVYALQKRKEKMRGEKVAKAMRDASTM